MKLKFYKCAACSGNKIINNPCVTNEKWIIKCSWPAGPEWEEIEMFESKPSKAGVAEDKEPSLEDLKFGDAIEGNDDGWILGKFCGIDRNGDAVIRIEEDHICWSFDEWRLPLKSRMRRGQPVASDKIRTFLLFDHWDQGNLITVNRFNCGTDWRLPTKDELEKLGHANGRDENGNPWLTSD